MKHQKQTRFALLSIATVLCVVAMADGEQEPFETPETSWRMVEHDCRPLRTTKHERQFGAAHSGQGCEHLQLLAGQGTHIYLAHEIQPVRIIPELSPTVWVKADRHGLQLMARVVLPRSLEKGKPVTSFLFGDRYEATGTWRQLRIDDVLTKLRREVVALRTQKGPQLDEREAYLDMLVLNVYTGPGPINIWCDDLEISGSVPSAMVERPKEIGPTESESPTVARTEEPSSTTATLQGNVLIVAGRPIFVRAIEHRGETFAFLKSLGFNTVKLLTTPTPNQLSEAERSGVWLVAPPAREQSANQAAASASPRVIAWFLGDQQTAAEWPDASRRMQAIIATEASPPRPFVANVTRALGQWRHESLIHLLDRPLLHTSFEMQDYVEWLRSAARQNRAQSPFWVAVPTEASEALQFQIAQFVTSPNAAVTVEPDQVRWAAFAGVASGARGLCFRSRTRLDGQDRNTKLRVATLRQLNQELDLLEPWAAAGTALEEQVTNNPRVRVFALRTDRARMLILLRRLSDQQFAIAPVEKQQVAFTLHNTPATDQTYAVSAGGVDLLPSQRGGGIRLTLDSPDIVSLVLLTSDPFAVNYAGRTASAIRSTTAAARRETVALLLEETEAVEREFQARDPAQTRYSQWLTEARSHLRRGDDLRESGDAKNLLRACDAAANAIRRVRRGRWEATVLGFTSPISSPVCASYSTLPIHSLLVQQLSNATWSVDLLAGGEMEYLEHLLQSGWTQQRAELAGVSVDVQVSLEAPRVGRSSLHMRAWASEQTAAALDGDSPVTITSAPVSVQAGQWLRVRGWVKVPRPIQGSGDGLMIYDSQSGLSLAERVTETQGWREFTLYRVTTTSGNWQLNFALAGLGEAWIDDVSVTSLAEVPVRTGR